MFVTSVFVFVDTGRREEDEDEGKKEGLELDISFLEATQDLTEAFSVGWEAVPGERVALLPESATLQHFNNSKVLRHAIQSAQLEL